MTRNSTSKRSQSNLSGRISSFLYRKVWSAPPSSASRILLFRNVFIKIISIVFLKIVQDAVTFRARGLALTVVMAMVPMLALGTAILKGVGISEETQHLAHEFFDRIVISNAPPADAMVDPEKRSHSGMGAYEVSD